MELAGTEAHTVEIGGELELEAAARHLGGQLEIRRGPEGGAEVSVLFFAMRRLGMVSPVRAGPRFDYDEALWRIGVVHEGAPAWFAVACDLDSAAVRGMGALLVRYPVRAAYLDISGVAAYARAEARAIAVRVGPEKAAPEPVPPRPLFVGSGRALFRVPWREDPAPFRREVELQVADAGLTGTTFGGEVTWSRTGLVHRGRTHRCGVAVRVRDRG
jgi:hypothetical protein